MTDTSVTMDTTKLEAFGGKMVDILNGASAALMISVGHQVKIGEVAPQCIVECLHFRFKGSGVHTLMEFISIHRVLFSVWVWPVEFG